MNTQTERALREALAFDPQTPSLPAEPIVKAVHRRRRRSQWAGAVAAGAVLAAGGFAVGTWTGEAPVVPAGVTEVSGTFDIAHDWQMFVDGEGGLCLANLDRTVYDCGVDVAFQIGRAHV